MTILKNLMATGAIFALIGCGRIDKVDVVTDTSPDPVVDNRGTDVPAVRTPTPTQVAMMADNRLDGEYILSRAVASDDVAIQTIDYRIDGICKVSVTYIADGWHNISQSFGCTLTNPVGQDIIVTSGQATAKWRISALGAVVQIADVVSTDDRSVQARRYSLVFVSGSLTETAESPDRSQRVVRVFTR